MIVPNTDPLPRDVWLDRYTKRIMKMARVPESFARQCAEAESFEVLSDGYADDPEGAADLELSYWGGD